MKVHAKGFVKGTKKTTIHKTKGPHDKIYRFYAWGETVERGSRERPRKLVASLLLKTDGSKNSFQCSLHPPPNPTIENFPTTQQPYKTDQTNKQKSANKKTPSPGFRTPVHWLGPSKLLHEQLMITVPQSKGGK